MTEKTEKNEMLEEMPEKPADGQQEISPKRFRFLPEGSLIRRIKIAVIMMLTVINITGILIMIPGTPLHHRLFPVYRNPYEHTEVRFTGKNGEGTVILYHDPGDEFSGLNYTMTPSEKLYNGDKIIIRADSVKGYRWSPAEAAVIVSGLADYVTDISQITITGLAPIEDNSEKMLDIEWRKIKEEGRIKDFRREPYKIYLFCRDTTGTAMNYLYDTYKTEVTRNDGTVLTVYEAYKYSALRTQRNNALIFRNGHLMNYNLGEKHGLGDDVSFSGWTDAPLMEEDLKVLHYNCSYAERQKDKYANTAVGR